MSVGRHVIIGGLGNLGKHMQRALLSKGLPTCVIDRRGGETGNKSIEFCPHQLGVDDPSSLSKALHNVDTVYSMVTPDVQHGTKDDFIKTNETGLRHLVDACKAAGVPKLVYISSIAVTNHFLPSINQSEKDPLPDLDTYVSAYDITKRNGEQIILDANETDKFHTCSLRIGGILAGHTDYGFRAFFSENSPTPGRIITVPSERIDHISARDVCKAMICASNKLNESNSQVSGQAMFVSKCAGNLSPKANEIAMKCSEILNWPITTIPSFVYSLIQGGTRLQDNLLDLVTPVDSRPGIPPHRFMSIVNYEQTFDNSLAKKLLDFEPDETWEDAVEWIIKDYKTRSKQKI